MRFVSTRGRAPAIDFRAAVLGGLAADGGLYMPQAWPRLAAQEIAAFADLSFAEAAARILALYAGNEVSLHDLELMAARAFGVFDHPEVAPLRALNNETDLLDLFYGPTLAFKDIAMRMLAELYGWALAGSRQVKTIIGATSGDTGAAAIAAFAGKDGCEVFMLHPKGRISEVQRRMMTTVRATNTVNIAVEGTFDDCQRIVKALFADERLKLQRDLGGVNSINWVRLAVQSTYFLTASARRPGAHFVVPTGNFGDIFAGYAAKKFGADIGLLIVATNQNDIVRRAIETGAYAPSGVAATTSPSMDIQVASNFERLLFDASGRDAPAIDALMGVFASAGRYEIPESWRARIAAEFVAGRALETEVAGAMKKVFETNGFLIDPHTAVGVAVAEKLRHSGRIDGQAICLATAHPAKFPDAVETATGQRPALPEQLFGLLDREEKYETAPADVTAIRALIETRGAYNEGPAS